MCPTTLTQLILMGMLISTTLAAEHREPEVFGEFEGEPMYSVLAPGAIPAILEPSFLSGEEADSQMRPDEPVIGLVIGGRVRAYSTWQLDSHEIVNDVVAGVPVAVNW